MHAQDRQRQPSDPGHRPGPRRPTRGGGHRNERPDPEGGKGAFADPADDALPHRRVRAAADRLAQPQGGRRMGDQADDGVGPRERPSGAVGLRPPRLAERALLRLHRLAGEGQPGRRGARVDAVDQGHGHGGSGARHSADRADPGRAHEVDRRDDPEGQGTDRAGRAPHHRAGDLHQGAAAARRRGSEAAVSGRRLRRTRRRAGAATRRRQPQPGRLTATAVAEQIDAMLVSAGAQVRINDAGRDHGQIRAFNNRTFDVAKAVPTVVLRNEDYGRIARLLADDTPVRARIQHRQPHVPGRADVLQRDRGDSGHRQEGRSGHARRPPRLVARARPARPTTRSAAR